MRIVLPEPCLVALIGASGSGKSTFARRHFRPTEILSSDAFRGWVSDDENNQESTKDAFAALHYMADVRLRRYKTVVVDATNVQEASRKPLVQLARQNDLPAVAIVLDLPPAVCHERNVSRPDREFGPHVVNNHSRQLRQSLRYLEKERFRYVHVLRGQEAIDEVEIERQPLWTNRSTETGPFDLIGDVHGCFDEMVDLLLALGYPVEGGLLGAHPEGRKPVFLGDLVDRGPDSPGVLRFVMDAVTRELAICVPGNHDERLLRKLKGREVKLTHGLAETIQQLEEQSPEFLLEVRKFLDSLRSHYVLDNWGLVAAHAGMKEEFIGRASGRVRSFALFGETTGETDEFGLPIRYPWASEYRGTAAVIYGHTPQIRAEWLNNTINIDTGCVFGGKLTALRWPERELVDVPARQTYAEPGRPLQGSEQSLQHQNDDVLDLADFIGKRIVETRLRGNAVVNEENAAAALEVMSRFAVDPRWLVTLPPTMSPPETSARPNLLEHPDEAFDYYRREGVLSVICEEKHMGSRALAIFARTEAAAKERFGIEGDGRGVIVTRTGRRFFDDRALEEQALARLDRALSDSGIWEELASDWIVLDGELLPWSAKAQGLLRDQYAPVGAAAVASTSYAEAITAQAAARGVDLEGMEVRMSERHGDAERFVAAYRQYCWPVAGIDDLRFAPFHVLASEGKVHSDRNHLWHMGIADRMASAEPFVKATPYREVHLNDEGSVQDAVDWWTSLTAAGGEGMVVKPLDFLHRGAKGLVQPGIKCRGAEYLRIIYGLEYLRPENLSRLRQRGVGRKRSLAMKEFGLGMEALQRFVDREPLRRVHECVFAVLALESEPVDPRL
ncbi:polynucleotide kinase-phosphatase [bacterium]|nr:MAG: polynucleotide kinase-phosphatase [bacterium]